MVVVGGFAVKVGRKEIVRAILPMQEHWVPFSNLDLLLPPVDVGVFFCYKNTSYVTFASMVSVLKKALAQTLVSYYAFAGEIVQNTVGEPELLCNNRGVDFIEAYADVELLDINLYNPDESIEGKLVPTKKHGVLSVQVTELKCGGVVVACTFDHRVSDGFSANMFLISWSEMAQSKPISHKPSFRRSLLNPRRPSSYPPSIDEMYALISALAPPENPPPDERDKLISRIYYIESDQLRRLQSSAGERTKLETFTAFLWKLIAQKNRGNCKMGIVVDGRRRLLDGNVGDHIEKYFGNVLSIPFGERTAEELTDRPLSWVANWVHEFMEKGATKEHFLGLIDWVEVHRPKPALARIYGGSSGGRSCVVSSGQRFPVEKVEFGWGKAAFGSYHFPWGGEAGYVMPMPSPKGNGDWVVYMHMFKGQLEFIENEAAHVFRPLTCDYLDLDV